jgi:hypothetical protein
MSRGITFNVDPGGSRESWSDSLPQKERRAFKEDKKTEMDSNSEFEKRF